MSQTYQGSCHCGAVKFSYTGEEITKGLRCNCSICARKGAMMSAEVIAPEALDIQAQEGALGCYQFGDKTAQHFFCKHCGIYTFHSTVRKPGYYRVNLGCLDGVDVFALDANVFDGKQLL
ncbi:MAG: GFA family protein [Chromatiaceae bacterium]|nr:GFA family protein [Chromatiaceae bacterium]